MAESTVTPFEDFSQRLRSKVAERDEALEAIDNDYAKSLAEGAVGDLYTPYLAERDSVINMFKLDAISIGKDYTHGAQGSSHPLPAPPAPSAAYPPQHHGRLPAMTGNQPIQQPELRERRPTRKPSLLASSAPVSSLCGSSPRSLLLTTPRRADRAVQRQEAMPAR